MIEGKDIVVTGGAGFIGSHIADALVKENDVTVIDDLSAGRRAFVPAAASFEKTDITDREALERALGDPDLVFHMAADARTRSNAMGWDNPDHNMDVNARGTLNLLRTLRALDATPRVVYASSAAVYGEVEETPVAEDHPTDPVSPYGIHKLAGEKYMRAFHAEQGMDTCSVRIFNTFGPRQPRYVMYDFLKKLQEDNTELEVLGSGRQVRDYAYISDTVHGFLTIAEEGASGEEYNISGQNVISVGDLAERIIDLTGLDADVHYTEETWTGDIDRMEADITKLNDLGFEPGVGLEDGLQRFIDWFEETEGRIRQ